MTDEPFQRNEAGFPPPSATAAAARRNLLRKPQDPKEPAFLELFFDLVYVFALTQLTQLIIDNLSWQGAFEALVLLLALWWVWVHTAWMTDQFNPQHAALQWFVILSTFAILLMAIVVPEGFRGNGLFFALTYFVISVGRVVFIVTAARGTDLPPRAIRSAFWIAPAALLWVPGAFIDGWRRGVLWLFALSVEYVSAALRWPTPRLGRAPTWTLTISEAHLAERYRQIFIIALGEIVLTMGLTFAGRGHEGFTFGRTTVLVLSFVSAALMWRLYIYQAGAQLGPAIASATDPHRISQWSAYAHMIMITGIILTAVGFTLIIERPTEQTPPAWIAGITGGPALFLAGRSGFEYVIFGRMSRHRLIGILVLAGLSAAVVHLRPEFTSAAATLVLALVAAFETARSRGRPAEPPAPPT